MSRVETSTNTCHTLVRCGFREVQVLTLRTGIAAKMKDMPIIDGSDYYFGFNSPTIMNAAGEIQTGVTTYTLAEGDAPTVIYR